MGLDLLNHVWVTCPLNLLQKNQLMLESFHKEWISSCILKCDEWKQLKKEYQLDEVLDTLGYYIELPDDISWHEKVYHKLFHQVFGGEFSVNLTNKNWGIKYVGKYSFCDFYNEYDGDMS